MTGAPRGQGRDSASTRDAASTRGSQPVAMRPKRCPPALSRGDRVALIGPAGPSPAAYIEKACDLLSSWGLDPVLGAHVRDVHARASYLAGADADRAADFRAAWLDDEIAGIICLRGGYGSMRILDHLDFSELAKARPKLFAGSSDITALHQAILARLGVATLFAPMPATDYVLEDALAQAQLRRSLFSFGQPMSITGPAAEAVTGGTAEGVLAGGNLSLVAAHIGSREYEQPVGAIGLLEEIHEEPYRLDLLLLELKRAGWFDTLSAIAFGSWEDCGDPGEVKALLLEYAEPLGIPTIWQLGFGHCAGASSVPLGLTARLIADAEHPRIEVL